HKRIRAVTRKPPWHDPLPPEKLVVFPGYRNLREMSQAHTRLMQKNLGLGWVAYLRPGNFRMFFTQPDLSGKNGSRAGANPRPRGIFHRVSLGLSDPPHQPLRPRLHSRWPAISRRHRSLSRLRSESSRRAASFEMAAGEARVQLSERPGIRRRVHPGLSGLRQVVAVISITRLDT